MVRTTAIMYVCVVFSVLFACHVLFLCNSVLDFVVHYAKSIKKGAPATLMTIGTRDARVT